MLMRNLLAIASLSFIVVFTTTPALAAINIEMVAVGDPGNPGELTGTVPILERICGAVNYTYQIGEFEVTNAQYIAFLNSVARYEDTYDLAKYAARLQEDGPLLCQHVNGIQRAGLGTSGDPYVYMVKNNDPNWNNKPVNFVSYYDCLRFINWLQNGQPEGNQVAGVTETGTYTFSDANTVTIPDHSSFITPHYVLPNENEWYKAAYYKGGDSNAGYWDYATQSDTTPDNNPPWLDTGNSANYNYNDFFAPYYLTDVGAYSQSPGPYCTFDQNGNVREWNDRLPSDTIPYNIIRGGRWSSLNHEELISSYNDYYKPDYYGRGTGFRIALVPEPVTVGLFTMGWVLFLFSSKSRRRISD